MKAEKLNHIYWAGAAGCALAIALSSADALADPIVQTQTIADAPSDFTSAATFAKFDPSLGTLTGVNVDLTGDLNGIVSFQSHEAAPSTITAGFNGTVGVSRPDASPIIAVAPSASTFANLAAFGAGSSSSGIATLSATANAATSGPTLSAADKALFTGPGSITLPVTAQVRSFENGPANLAAQFQAKAGASVGLTYNFAAPGQSGGGSSGGGVITTMANIGSLTTLLGSVTSAPQIGTVADQTTGWNNALSFQKFNPALGKLEDINLTLTSDVKAQQSFQNLGATSTTVDATQQAALSLSLGSNNLLDVMTALSKSVILAGFDGKAHFSGSSGVIFAGLFGADTNEASLGDSSDLALFTGLDSIALDLSAIGTSSADGPGNLLLDLSEQAGATVDLTYTYLPSSPNSDAPLTVPEPPSWLLLAGSLALSAMLARGRHLNLLCRVTASLDKQSAANTLDAWVFL